jgi:NAD/NADP transhydrogenase beta subunit
MTGEKLKVVLTGQSDECEKIICEFNRKYKIVKIIYYSLMVTSIIGSTIMSIIATYTIPPLVFGIVSGCTAIIIAVSFKFNVENIKVKLNKKIHRLHKIKDELDYIISCNGELTEEECKRIMLEFRDL